jgi:hypothetical protein
MRWIATVVVSCVLAASASAAVAPAQRTFVSAASGNDANPCTRPSPCRNFAAAAAMTLPLGEVIVLDSGGFGAVSISQPMSITAPPGVYAGITTFTGNAINVAVGNSDWVSINGLTLTNLLPWGNGNVYGVIFSAGGHLDLDRMTIGPYTAQVYQQAGHLVMSHSKTHGDPNNAEYGVLVESQPAILSPVTALVQDSILETQGDALSVTGPHATATALRVSAIDSGIDGFVADGGATLTVVESAATGGFIGVVKGCAGTTIVYVSRSTLTGNAVSMSNCGGGGFFYSLKDNTVGASASSGTITPATSQ